MFCFKLRFDVLTGIRVIDVDRRGLKKTKDWISRDPTWLGDGMTNIERD